MGSSSETTLLEQLTAVAGARFVRGESAPTLFQACKRQKPADNNCGPL
jgi:hypothetical protein